MTTLLSEIILGDMAVQYHLDDETQRVGLQLMPQGMQERAQAKRQELDPLVQLMIQGDGFPNGFANGHTLRNGSTVNRFRYAGQTVAQAQNLRHIVTTLRSEDGQQVTHTLTHDRRFGGVQIVTAYQNNGDRPVTLSLLSSFCLGGLTPFIAGDAPESLVIHRLRSRWSNEARLESIPAEDLQLEPSWSGYGVACERFGQTGSMPVRRFFPMVVVEDTRSHVFWGAQLACPSSWQMELYRRDDALCVSGGLADEDFGHWQKTLLPGEAFTAPAATLSVCAGTLDDLCDRLTAMHSRPLERLAMPARLPVVFNEFCTTWGNPSSGNIRRILSLLRGRDIDYFVIDSGWYADEVKGWEANMGDWDINGRLFPDGLEATVAEIREAGLKPGIWFEPEVCGQDARAFQETRHLLRRHGAPITVGKRRFWDLCDPWVQAYLKDRVVGLLRRYGFSYVKIDYNDSIGIGCDHPDGPGEGLRLNQLAARDFLASIPEALPGIVLENCSSGGHRLEPSFLGISQLSSFSDAHEVREIPIVAANLHRAMLPRQSLIWAVLRKQDSPKRLAWSLCATFLGVMCLSGDVYDLSEAQWSIVEEGIRFYRMVSPIIEDGVSLRHGPAVASYRHPKGWQALERTTRDGKEKLIVVHVFDREEVAIDLPLDGAYRIHAQFGDASCRAAVREGRLALALANGAFALCLRGEPSCCPSGRLPLAAL
ncbi:MAG: alpha-galactosidase [Clostridiales bacterium]|nr:alpha-galactosidase [Clostridiales bacterium]